ncbi:cytochrome P450 [Penicillium malachiteum]|uniref:cytochrome P450 n=1 Tax=Penicillium malachiteum TaxID=1324776 RepID=UPI0025481F2C|nr:cytochrome P450 [Penicillium malachiteum]KAJ5714844.1 cytochrome P450 [Penicillium malachiteum]
MFTAGYLLYNAAIYGTLILVAHFCWNFFTSTVRSFPGPGPTRFTNLWRLRDAFKGRCDITQLRLHRKYGSAVRLGPNMLSLSDPALIHQVYSTKTRWMKSEMYNVNDTMVNGARRKDIFSHRDEEWHSTFIRPVRPLFSMTKVQEYQPAIDTILKILVENIRERFVETHQACDMSPYVGYFAWDTMSQITFSKDLGMLEHGRDERNLMEISTKTSDYFSPISQFPKLDFILNKSPIYRIGPPSSGWGVLFGIEQDKNRLKNGRPKSQSTESQPIVYFMDKYISLKDKYPNTVTDDTIITYLLSNIAAGSDTAASTMRAVVYYILKNPSVRQRLCEELRSADLSYPPEWKKLQGLKYLEAVMRESMRINPGVGFSLERVVPKGGLTLPDGRFIPEGTIVGNEPLERWLRADYEAEEEYQARIQAMKGANFTFGAGTRSCVGRYLSELEASKFLATLFTTFDMELPSLDHEWKVTNSMFVRQENIPVIIQDAS